jgi:alkanesulfonate monooxygenase SsuD/methylene tetrahydromethanopterin reductase-like flavin-dependent oxidoreductase (luciferase family)
MTQVSAVGSPETVRRWVEQFLAETGVDEVIATAQIYDHTARLRSFELAAGVFEEMNRSRGDGAPVATSGMAG